MMVILNGQRKKQYSIFGKQTVSIIRQELELLTNTVQGEIINFAARMARQNDQQAPSYDRGQTNQNLFVMMSQIEKYQHQLPIFDPHDMANDLIQLIPNNFVSNKKMLENMFSDVKAIFDHAPKLFIEHYDDMPKCLPKDLIIVNAFGQLSEI